MIASFSPSKTNMIHPVARSILQQPQVAVSCRKPHPSLWIVLCAPNLLKAVPRQQTVAPCLPRKAALGEVLAEVGQDVPGSRNEVSVAVDEHKVLGGSDGASGFVILLVS